MVCLFGSVNLQLDSSRKPAMQICIRVGCSCLQTGICCIPGPLDMQSQWLNLCTYPTTITRSKRQQNLVNARCPKQAQGMGWQQHMQAIVCRCLCHGCHMTHTHPRQKNWRNSGGELQVHSRESMPFSCQVAQGTKCHLSRSSSAITEKQGLAQLLACSARPK